MKIFFFLRIQIWTNEKVVSTGQNNQIWSNEKVVFIGQNNPMETTEKPLWHTYKNKSSKYHLFKVNIFREGE